MNKEDSKSPGHHMLETREDEATASAEPDGNADIMQAVLAKPSHIGKPSLTTESRMNGVVIGTLSSIKENGQVMVHYPGIPGDEPVSAITTEELSADNIDNDIALGFVNGNPVKPVILGLIQKTTNVSELTFKPENDEQIVDVKLDGEKLTLSAEKEIVLKCGKSSITLTRAGKVIVKGAYISHHSSGVNRIKGGSVQIN